MDSSNKRYSQDELAMLFQRFFNSQDGKDVLYVLETQFRNKPLIPTSVSDGNALIPLTFTRIGEDNVVRYIQSLVNRKIGKDQ